jgi:hypothetical protein
MRFRLCCRAALVAAGLSTAAAHADVANLSDVFQHPPESARPWVYWYFMDGNMSGPGMRADLESMKGAGLGGAIFLEVNVGIPRGPVTFMGDEWQRLVAGAMVDADRLGLQVALGTGPGWCGAGGPWVTPDLAMQHLVGSQTRAAGPARFDQVLPQPKPRTPFFGMATLVPPFKQQWETYYRDEAVVAFPTPAGKARTGDIGERALYFRAPFSSAKGVKPYLPEVAATQPVPADQCVDPATVVDLTGKMDASGRLVWDVPPGAWTIVRLGRTLTGQTTRPAPVPGLGWETDKFNPAALDAHFAAYVDKVLRAVPPAAVGGSAGLTMLHFDSWEMSSQNWSAGFRDAFRSRRGYDPLPYLPAMLGRVIGSPDATERFLWDLRQTAQELVVANQAMHLRDLAHARGLTLSLEPYDLDPCADLKLGMAADLPMGEFWSTDHGFHTEYSIIEATSVGHTMGRPVIGAESFTAGADEHWLQYPGSMKAQTDWALCAGINKFVIHRCEHQPAEDQFPGMTMGPYGVHWERTQTWWPMVPAYHAYLTRCSALLRQGRPVADVLYLTPEGAPMVFQPPASALAGPMGDRRGYSFDGCCPDVLLDRVSVRDGKLVFPDGMTYRLLVLPELRSMTPALLAKVDQLLRAGATVIGGPPDRAPGLTGDAEVRQLARTIWGNPAPATGPATAVAAADAPWPRRSVGGGTLVVDPTVPTFPNLYPDYAVTAAVLSGMGVPPDFDADAPIRFVHRRLAGDAQASDLYFVANTQPQVVETVCRFRATGAPQWWDAVTGRARPLTALSTRDGVTSIPMRFDPLGSGFVVFAPATPVPQRPPATSPANFAVPRTLLTVAGPWTVHFDPRWGGPARVTFDALTDWTKRSEPGIRGYSGRATYETTFAADAVALSADRPTTLCLGNVKDIASVRLNGRDLGVAWCVPWRVAVPAGTLQPSNRLEVTVANLWVNRLITDAGLPEAQRLTRTTWNPFKPTSTLQPSGLLGPVTVEVDGDPR